MRPPTHDNPNAIPRNGTDVPWLELDDPSHNQARTGGPQQQDGRATASAAGEPAAEALTVGRGLSPSGSS